MDNNDAKPRLIRRVICCKNFIFRWRIEREKKSSLCHLSKLEEESMIKLQDWTEIDDEFNEEKILISYYLYPVFVDFANYLLIDSLDLSFLKWKKYNPDVMKFF